MSTENFESYIEIKNVWKVFGNTSQQALNAIKKKEYFKTRGFRKI